VTRRITLAVGVALVLTLAACSSSDDDPLGGATTTTAGPSKPANADPDAACEPDDLDPDALEPRMLDEREGFVLQPDEVGDTGPSDLAKAIRDDTLDDAEEVLRDLGFRRGYQRFWRNKADGELVDFVYEFCDDEGATAYEERVVDEIGGDRTTFEVVGHPGYRGFAGTVDGFAQAYALTVADGFLVFSIAGGPEGTVLIRELQQRATSLVADQVGELTAT
jgi:hypothetical protein